MDRPKRERWQEGWVEEEAFITLTPCWRLNFQGASHWIEIVEYSEEKTMYNQKYPPNSSFDCQTSNFNHLYDLCL